MFGAPDIDPAQQWPWYYFVLTGLACLACLAGTAWLHYYISSAEQQGQAIRLPRFIAFAYELLGKWPTTGILGTISAAIICVGIWSLISPDDAAKKQAAADKPAK